MKQAERRKKKSAPEVDANGLNTYTLFDQRQPIRKENSAFYEANFVRVGEIKAKSSHEALEIAKEKGLAEKPAVWGPETEKMRDIYHQRQRRFRDDEEGR